MNCPKQILILFVVFFALALVTATDESKSNSSSEPSGPEVIKESVSKRSSKRGMNRGKGFSGRAGLSYYSQPSYNNQDSVSATYNKINSRDSSAYGIGTPITSSSYSSPAGAVSYSPSYPAPAYSLPSPYPVPSYDDDDLVLHNYDDEHNKRKKIALGISLPLALVLGPLAFIGIVALLNLRSVFTIAILRSLCNNDTFSANFSGLCTLIGNLKKRSDDEAGFKSDDHSPHYSRLMTFLNNAAFSAMDHLNAVNNKEN